MLDLFHHIKNSGKNDKNVDENVNILVVGLASVCREFYASCRQVKYSEVKKSIHRCKIDND